MSTRCQIEFKVISSQTDKRGRKKSYEETRLVYQHWDGYPENVIPELQDFLKWDVGRNFDIEYMVANFIWWVKDRTDSKDSGFGVCKKGGLHGDIDYFYQVIADVRERCKNGITIKIYCIAYGEEGKDTISKIHGQLFNHIGTVKLDRNAKHQSTFGIPEVVK